MLRIQQPAIRIESVGACGVDIDASVALDVQHSFYVEDVEHVVVAEGDGSRTLAEACDHLVDDPEARAIGGGTALLILIKQGVYMPATLVNLRKITNEAGISLDDGWLLLSSGTLRIASFATTLRELGGPCALAIAAPPGDPGRHPIVR